MRFSGGREEGGSDSMKELFERHALGWVGALLVLYGYYLNANMSDKCWIVWFIGNSLVGVYCLERKAYPTAAMSFILVFLNVYGYLNWLDK